MSDILHRRHYSSVQQLNNNKVKLKVIWLFVILNLRYYFNYVYYIYSNYIYEQFGSFKIFFFLHVLVIFIDAWVHHSVIQLLKYKDQMYLSSKDLVLIGFKKTTCCKNNM